MLALEVLPQLVRECDSELLAGPLEQHLEETRGHVDRVEAVFGAVGVEPTSAASAALEGLQRQHDQHIGEAVQPRLRDLFLIDCATRTEALESALYVSALAVASLLEVDASPLAANRAEEDAARRALEAARTSLLERA